MGKEALGDPGRHLEETQAPRAQVSHCDLCASCLGGPRTESDWGMAGRQQVLPLFLTHLMRVACRVAFPALAVRLPVASSVCYTCT